MTIDEAVHRVIRGHWLLLLLCMALPVAATLVLGSRTPALYEAVARVQMGREPAASNVQADATSERVLGIATSVSVVRSALEHAGLAADPATFARDFVDVRRVGVSSVVEIAVRELSPSRAAAIASSITSSVLQFSNLGDQKTVEEGRAEVNRKLSDLRKQRSALVARLARAQPGDVLAIQAQLGSLMSSQTEYERQLSELDIAELSRPKAVLLDPVLQPTAALPKDTTQKAVLALLIGTLLGLGLAAARETIRPRLRNARAIAYALDVPHLGHLRRQDWPDERSGAAAGRLADRTADRTADRIADRVALLGQRYDADRLLLLLARPADDSLARVLVRSLQPESAGHRHRLPCDVLGAEWVDTGESPVAVALVPRVVLARDLEPMTTLLEGLGWPLLGVVTYDRRRRRLWRRRRPGPRHGEASVVGGARDDQAEHDSVIRSTVTPAAAPAARTMPADQLRDQQEVFHR